MNELKYCVTFADLRDTPQRAHIMFHATSLQEYVVEVNAGEANLARLGRQPLGSIPADLIDLATAIYSTDRVCPNKAGKIRHIQLTIPIRNSELFSSREIKTEIEHCLAYFTHDHWTLNFLRRKAEPRSAELQHGLDLRSTNSGMTETALWSDGLDSLAGLLSRMYELPSHRFTLVGSGSSDTVASRQRFTYKLINQIFPGRVSLVQIPIRRRGTQNLPGLNSELRTRGFVFLLLGLVVSIIQGQSELSVYENGIGAFNLSYSDGEVGVDQTRAVNPIALYRVAKLASRVTGRELKIHNRFQFATKAEMCSILSHFDKQTARNLVCATSSCDRPHREVPHQCGTCSSCLLRIQALRVAGIEDPTKYLVPDRRSAQGNEAIYLTAMSQQVKFIDAILNSEVPWPKMLEEFHLLAHCQRLTVQGFSSQTISLYRRYVDEWQRVIPFLNRRMTRECGPTNCLDSHSTHAQLQLW